MILIKHVLVATDFSEPSAAALNYGRELARTFAATLHVLHVADNVTFQYGVEGYSTLLPEMQEDVEAAARKQLDALITEEDRVALHAEPVVITAVAQGRRHRPLRQRAPDGSHRHGHTWPRRDQSPLDGQCRRARGADRPLSGADGAPSRARIRHPRRAGRRRASLIMHTLSPPLPAADDLDTHRLVLRDGSVAIVRPAGPSDHEAMRRFFHELSPESRRHRFFIAGEPPDAVIDRFCTAADPAESLTLIACRRSGDDERIVAVASYFRITDAVAEAAFAVDDRLHGKGIATLLLERLAALASANGFQRFQATTMAENRAMIEVFRDSGFEVRSRLDDTTLEVQLSLSPSDRQRRGRGTAEPAGDRRVAAAAVLTPRPSRSSARRATATSIGGRILGALVAAGFHGPIYPINPHAAEINGVPALRSARDLPAGVDLAILAVPAPAILGVVDDCAAAGVKSLVVVTAGFAEAGIDGRALQDQLVDKVRGYGMRMVGPNCMGLLNTDPAVTLNASFSPMFPRAGHIALSSQSGALGLAILGLAAAREVGLSQFVSVGNKADVSGNDLLEYWESDPRTHVILLYLESFGNPRRFARLARRISRTKPIVAVKAGRTRAGSRAAGSHTAALAASDTAVDALFHQSGVIRADTIDEMFDIAACLDAQPLPTGRPRGDRHQRRRTGHSGRRRVRRGGPDRHRVLGRHVRQARARFLPSTASVGNPVDMVASAGPEEYRQTIEVAAAADDADALLVIFTPVDTSRSEAILAAIRDGIRAARGHGHRKPILACVMTDGRPPVPLRVDDETVPTYAFPENAARALGEDRRLRRWRAQPPGLFWGFDDVRVDEARDICRRALTRHGDGWLTTEETHAVLHAFGLPLAAGAVARTADEAAALAAVLGFPVVAKLASRQVVHKSDIGAVRLNLDDRGRRCGTPFARSARASPSRRRLTNPTAC